MYVLQCNALTYITTLLTEKCISHRTRFITERRERESKNKKAYYYDVLKDIRFDI